MDITKNNAKRYTNSFINGETVNYVICALISFFTLLAFKQLLKMTFGISADTAAYISFAVAEVVLFVLQKFFVFGDNALSSLPKQIIYSVVAGGIHLGIFAVISLIFKSVGLYNYAAWFASFVFIFVLNYPLARILIFDCYLPAERFKNGRIYKVFFGNRFVLLSMAVTFLVFAFIYLVFHAFPFGDTTVLRMDLYHQYGPLFCELYDRVTQGKSFLYSWTSGGGSSFLGNYFNYLSSPFNIILFLFDRKNMPLAITAIVAVKGIACSGTFTFYLKKSLNRHSASSAMFGLFYAFSGYFLAYFWNVMWLDGMIILPLVVLGIERIINKGKPALYFFSLIYIFIASYYIAYMVCIFSVIYFIAYYFISSPKQTQMIKAEENGKFDAVKSFFAKPFINKGLKFAGASLLAAGICACFLIPVYFILSGCSATSDSFPKEFKTYFSLFDFITTHFASLETTIRSSGSDVLPNVYCSVLTLVLVPLFMLNRDIRTKEKAIYALLIAFFLFSFNTNYANFVWHAFHFPNDLPYRFSFMYSFLMLVIGFKSLMKISSIGIKEIGITGLMWIVVIALADELPTEKMQRSTSYVTLAFLLIWICILFLIKRKAVSKFIASVLIIACAFCEAVVANPSAFSLNQKLGGYVKNYNGYTKAIEYIADNDTSNYRTELCSLNTRMDSCLYGYNGMSTFSSMAYEKYSGVQYSLGMYGNRINSYTYNTQTPVYNMMYNIKYLIYNNEQTRPSTQLYTRYYADESSNAAVYQNDYYLPKAFCVNSAVEKWSASEGNPFRVQSDFFTLATGYSGVFEEAQIDYASYTGMTGENPEGSGTIWVTKNDDNSYASFDITISAVTNGNIYIYASAKDLNSITVSSEGGSSTFDISTPYIIDLGYANAGEKFGISFDCASLSVGETGIEFYAYSVNEKVLDAGYNNLLKGAMEITEYSETKIKGTVVSDFNNILYSSIPYDEGWEVYIDGQKAETFKIADCQLGVMIKPGEHTVEYIYRPRGITAGCAISACSVIALAAVYFYKKRNKNINNDKLVKS